jgi:hypothetical protein
MSKNLHPAHKPARLPGADRNFDDCRGGLCAFLAEIPSRRPKRNWTINRPQPFIQRLSAGSGRDRLGISRGRNAMAIWQELVDTCGFASG